MEDEHVHERAHEDGDACLECEQALPMRPWNFSVSRPPGEGGLGGDVEREPQLKNISVVWASFGEGSQTLYKRLREGGLYRGSALGGRKALQGHTGASGGIGGGQLPLG